MMRFLWVSLLVFGAAGCDRRNTDCQWPAEISRALDLRKPADEQHLVQDVILAEDLAVRYGDVRWPPGAERRRRRDAECLNVLFSELTGRHDVTLDAVQRARERSADKGLNLAVNVPIGIFSTLIALVAARRVRRRFAGDDERLAALLATVLVSVLVGGATMGLGALWETVIEIVRVGNTHLSYRGGRVQWGNGNGWMLFLLGVVLSWLTSLLHFWMGRTRQRGPDESGYAA